MNSRSGSLATARKWQTGGFGLKHSEAPKHRPKRCPGPCARIVKCRPVHHRSHAPHVEPTHPVLTTHAAHISRPQIIPSPPHAAPAPVARRQRILHDLWHVTHTDAGGDRVAKAARHGQPRHVVVSQPHAKRADRAAMQRVRRDAAAAREHTRGLRHQTGRVLVGHLNGDGAPPAAASAAAVDASQHAPAWAEVGQAE
eukprot:360117-Chlamydomonas_euryale.AAC.6